MEFFRYLEQSDGYTDLKVLKTGKWAGVKPFMFTHAIITGRLGDTTGYEDRWCYHDKASAQKALAEWDGEGEPKGWHRHPDSGRRIGEDGELYVMY